MYEPTTSVAVGLLGTAGRVFLACLAVLALGSSVIANGSWSVGATFTPARSATATNAHVAWAPFAWKSGEAQFRIAARADGALVLLASGALLSGGLATVLAVHVDNSPEIYAGVGIGVGGSSVHTTGALLAVYWLTGIAFELYRDLDGIVEYQVAHATGMTVHSVSLGARWNFGGRK